MIKHFDGKTIYWEVGDKAMVYYFGNDESRHGTLVEVDVINVSSDTFYRAGETGRVTIRLMDSVNNEDEDGNSRDHYEAIRWSSELHEV